jgi:hypothetical protein
MNGILLFWAVCFQNEDIQSDRAEEAFFLLPNKA